MKEQDNKRAIYFQLPSENYELPYKTQETARQLVENPAELGNFRKLIDDNLFLAKASENSEKQHLLEEYLKHVETELGRFRWEKIRSKKLTVEEAKQILTNLPSENSIENGPSSRIAGLIT